MPDILGADYLETLFEKDIQGGDSHVKGFFAINVVDRKISCCKRVLRCKHGI